MDLGLRDATAVVTGGTKGMGRATAQLLARDASRSNSYMTGANVNVDGGSDFT